MPTKDFVDRTVGFWTVLEYVGNSRWLCQCVCGTIKTVNATTLRRGQSRSCGCKNHDFRREKIIKDELGKTYGRLTVVERADIRGGEQYWLCECECGNTTVVRGSHLRDGSVRSCMCLAHEMTVERQTTHGLSKTKAYQVAMCKIRCDAEKLIETQWTPEMELFLRRLFPYCVVCGMSEREHLEMYGQRLHIDHVNPLVQGNPLGPGNAVVLCKHCNCTKWSHSLDELPYEMALPIQVAADTFNVLWKGQ